MDLARELIERAATNPREISSRVVVGADGGLANVFVYVTLIVDAEYGASNRIVSAAWMIEFVTT